MDSSKFAENTFVIVFWISWEMWLTSYVWIITIFCNWMLLALNLRSCTLCPSLALCSASTTAIHGLTVLLVWAYLKPAWKFMLALAVFFQQVIIAQLVYYVIQYCIWNICSWASTEDRNYLWQVGIFKKDSCGNNLQND